MDESGGPTHVDWHALARELGTLWDDGESGGTDVARRALELILGAETVRGAVDHYVAGRRGSELARSVLALLRPASAIERCLELFRSGTPETRRDAVELLRVVADARVLARVPEFLNDSDEGVQTWGAGVVDQLAWSGLVDIEGCGPLLEVMLQHSNAEVRRLAGEVRTRLRAAE